MITPSARARRLWAIFEIWYNEKRLILERDHDRLYKQMDILWRSAPPATRESPVDLKKRKDALKVDALKQLRETAREEWDKRLEEARLDVYDWTDITLEEQITVMKILGDGQEVEEPMPAVPSTMNNPVDNSAASHSRASYIGAKLTDFEDEDDEDEASFQAFTRQVRAEKIREFHQEAAETEIQLAQQITFLRKDKTKAAQVPQLVSMHQERMLLLQKTKENERKQIVALEREKRREEIRGRSWGGGSSKKVSFAAMDTVRFSHERSDFEDTTPWQTQSASVPTPWQAQAKASFKDASRWESIATSSSNDATPWQAQANGQGLEAAAETLLDSWGVSTRMAAQISVPVQQSPVEEPAPVTEAPVEQNGTPEPKLSKAAKKKGKKKGNAVPAPAPPAKQPVKATPPNPAAEAKPAPPIPAAVQTPPVIEQRSPNFPTANPSPPGPVWGSVSHQNNKPSTTKPHGSGSNVKQSTMAPVSIDKWASTAEANPPARTPIWGSASTSNAVPRYPKESQKAPVFSSSSSSAANASLKASIQTSTPPQFWEPPRIEKSQSLPQEPITEPAERTRRVSEPGNNKTTASNGKKRSVTIEEIADEDTWPYQLKKSHGSGIVEPKPAKPSATYDSLLDDAQQNNTNWNNVVRSGNEKHVRWTPSVVGGRSTPSEAPSDTLAELSFSGDDDLFSAAWAVLNDREEVPQQRQSGMPLHFRKWMRELHVD